MKVFACRGSGGYSGGLAIVAANTKEEAYLVFHSHEKYKYMLNGIDMTDDYGGYSDDPNKCDSYYYPKGGWYELPLLVANVDKPQFIAEDGYTE